MAELLPEYTTIAKTPDLYPSSADGANTCNIKKETVEIKTADLIDAFMGLQREASAEEERRAKAESARKIRIMAYF